MRSSRSLDSTNVVVKLKKEKGGCGGRRGEELMLKALKPFFFLFVFLSFFLFQHTIKKNETFFYFLVEVQAYFLHCQ